MNPGLSIGQAVEGARNNFHLMRLFAALLVIYGHCYPISGNIGPDLVQKALGIRFAGSLATDTFFIVSGFLITASVEKGSLYKYLWARFLRIFPALFICVLLTVFVLGPIVTNAPGYWQDPQTWRYLQKSSTLTGGLSVLPGVFTGAPRPSVNGSLWTLNVEVRLYLLTFLLALVGMRKGSRYSWLILATFVVGFFYIPKFWPFSYLTTSDRWISPITLFLAGAFVWKNRYAVPLSFPLLALLLGFAALAHGTAQFEIAYFICLVYLVFFLAYVPRLPVIRYRDLSYGVYLYGWPVQQLVEFYRPGSTAMFNMVWSMAIALGLAFLSWELVEKHAIGLKRIMQSPFADASRATSYAARSLGLKSRQRVIQEKEAW
jgi:peptidoglycan/LPS O-acetylase OafA/YrhL